MRMSQRAVLTDDRTTLELDEGGLSCTSSPDWVTTWVPWDEVDRLEVVSAGRRWVLVAPRRDER